MNPFYNTLCLAALFWTHLAFGLPTGNTNKAPATLDILRKESLSPSDYEELYFRLYDDPTSILRELLSIWSQPLEPLSHLTKARVGWFIAKAWTDNLNDGVKRDFVPIFQETRALIEQEKLSVSSREVRFHELYYLATKQKIDFIKSEDELFKLAYQIENPSERAHALSQLAFELVDRGINDQELLKALTETRKIINFQARAITVREADALNSIKLVLMQIGQLDESKLINDQIDKVCLEKKVRSYCSNRAYDSGRNIIATNSPDSGLKAIPYFMQSLRLAEQIHNTYRIASGYYGLNVAYNKAGEFEKAIDFGRKSVDFFEQGGNKDWAASALKNLSVSYLGARDFSKALQAAQKALSYCPPEFKNDQKLIYLQLSNIYEGMGDPKMALKAFKTYHDLDNQTRTEETNKEYSIIRSKAELEIKDQKNKVLQKENDLNRQALAEAKKIRAAMLIILLLFFCVIGLLGYALSRSRLIHKSRDKMQRILSSIDEGILTIDSELKIESEYSLYLQKVLANPNDLAGQDVIQLLFERTGLHAEEQSIARESLKASFGDSLVGWDMNSHHLPQEISLNHEGHDRYLLLYWQPIVDEQDRIHSILLSVRDDTERRNLQRNVDDQKQEQMIWQKILQELFHKNLDLASKTFDRAERLMEQTPDVTTRSPRVDQYLSQLHTIKGEARTLGLDELSRAVHVLEDCAKSAHAGHGGQTFEEKRSALVAILVHYKKITNSLSAAPLDTKTRPAESDLLEQILPHWRNVQAQLGKSGVKAAKLEIVDAVVQWPRSLLQDVSDVILHAMTNSVDHGFLIPLANGARLEPPAFAVSCEIQDARLKVRISDNGVGLNLAKLQKLAEARGFHPGQGQTWADVVFESGVSTAESTTLSSGRGVGMVAIQNIARSRNGLARIRPAAKGRGTELELVMSFQSEPTDELNSADRPDLAG